MAKDNRLARQGYLYCNGEQGGGTSTRTYHSITTSPEQQSTLWKKSFKKSDFSFDLWTENPTSGDREVVLLTPDFITNNGSDLLYLHRDLIYVAYDEPKMIKFWACDYAFATGTVSLTSELEFETISVITEEVPDRILVGNKEIKVSDLIEEGNAYTRILIGEAIRSELANKHLLIEFISPGDFVRKENFEQDLDMTAKVVFNSLEATNSVRGVQGYFSDRLTTINNETSRKDILRNRSLGWLPSDKHVKKELVNEMFRLKGETFYNLPFNLPSGPNGDYMFGEWGYSFTALPNNYITEDLGLAFYSKFKPTDLDESISYQGLIQYNATTNTLEFGMSSEFNNNAHSPNLKGALPFVPKIKGNYTDIVPLSIPYFIPEEPVGSSPERALYEKSRETLKYSEAFRVEEDTEGDIQEVTIPRTLTVNTGYKWSNTASFKVSQSTLKLNTNYHTSLFTLQSDGAVTGLHKFFKSLSLYSSTSSVDSNTRITSSIIHGDCSVLPIVEVGRLNANHTLGTKYFESLKEGSILNLYGETINAYGDLKLNYEENYVPHIPLYHSTLNPLTEYSGVFNTYSRIESPTIDIIHKEIEAIILGDMYSGGSSPLATHYGNFEVELDTINCLAFLNLEGYSYEDYNTGINLPPSGQKSKVQSLMSLTSAIWQTFYDFKVLSKFLAKEKTSNGLGVWQVTKQTDLKVSTKDTEDKVLNYYRDNDSYQGTTDLDEYKNYSVVTGNGNITHASNLMVLAIED